MWWRVNLRRDTDRSNLANGTDRQGMKRDETKRNETRNTKQKERAGNLANEG